MRIIVKKTFVQIFLKNSSKFDVHFIRLDPNPNPAIQISANPKPWSCQLPITVRIDDDIKEHVKILDDNRQHSGT